MGVVTSDVDLSAARFAQGIPFETFAELRRSAPVYWYEPDRYWVVTSYELVRSINRDATVFSNTQGTTGAALRQEEGDEPLGVRTILTMDPPQHTRCGSVISASGGPGHGTATAWSSSAVSVDLG